MVLSVNVGAVWELDSRLQINGSDRIGVRERYVDYPLIPVQQHCGRVRTGRDGTILSREVDPACNPSACEVEFRDGRAVPQADPRFGSGFVGYHRVRICAGNVAAAA